MQQLPLYPLWIIDIVGSLTMVVLSILCCQQTFKLRKNDPENALSIYLVWLFAAILAFCLFRSVGHILKHLLLFSGHPGVWQKLAPISGSVNTTTFVIIFGVTLFFRSMVILMDHMIRDKVKIEQTSRQLFALNKDIEAIVSDRTRAEFAIHLAHQIRNPIMVIGGLIKRLVKDVDKDERAHSYQTAILEQTDELESIVSRFEKLQSALHGHFQPIELNVLIRDTLDIIRHDADSKKISLQYIPFSTALPLQGDQQYLKVAFLHLLRNSIDACPTGGHITVSTKLGDKGAILLIEDNGTGIEEEVLRHIFEPFYSTKKGETGLGLPYVHQIIREHRGDIKVTSSLGKGTKAIITIPTHLIELN